MAPKIKYLSPKEYKGVLIGFKLTEPVVRKIDLEAELEGLSRSAVIRRILLRYYSGNTSR